MLKKIKVLQVLPSFGVGGAEKVVLEYLLNYNKENMEMRAISLYPSSNSVYDQIIQEKNLDVIYLNKNSGFDFTMFIKLYKQIVEFKPDVVHSHLHVLKYLIFSFFKCKQIKLFHTIHSEPERDVNKFDKFLNNISFKYFNVIPIALSTKMAIKNNEFYKINSTKVLNNGINMSKFKKNERIRIEIRKSLGLCDDTLVLGHIGRFDMYKNQLFLIRVLEKLVEKYRNIHLLLIGDGELRIQIEKVVEAKQLSNFISFLGTRSDIASLYNAMDIFVFPSIYEGFPMTLIEAQASEVNCIISDNIDNSCILTNNAISLSLDNSLESWCEAILSFSNVPTKLNKIENYDIKKVIQKLEILYNETSS